MIEFAENAALRNILLDAAATEYADVLSDTESIAVSSRFQRQMQAMLENPNGWAKRRLRPLWKKSIQVAAAVILVCSLSLGALMAISPTVRAAVVNWVTEWYDTYVVYRFSGKSTTDAMPGYDITALPDGYNANGSVLELPGDFEITYANHDGQNIRFEYARVEKGAALMVRTENMVVSDVMINGCSGKLYLSTDPQQSSAVVWVDEQSNLQFIIDGFVGGKELLHMAESVSLVNSTK